MQNFQPDSRIADDSFFVVRFPLCDARLMNNARYPWIILLPRVSGITEIFQMEKKDRIQLLEESSFTASVMNRIYSPDKMNVGYLGNIVSQLHIHHIARFMTDDAWPGPVWGKHPPVHYSREKRKEILLMLEKELAFSG